MPGWLKDVTQVAWPPATATASHPLIAALLAMNATVPGVLPVLVVTVAVRVTC